MANENNKIKLLLLWDILSKNTDESHAMNAERIFYAIKQYCCKIES